MEEQKIFTQRVKETVIHCACLYKKYYVEYEYLLCSKAFEKSEYYIISAHEDNYLHLTGLHTNLDAGNVSATLGFIIAGNAKPMTLLKGNELNSSKAKKLDLVLRRRAGETKFSEIIIGATEQLLEHKSVLNELLSDELCALIKSNQ